MASPPSEGDLLVRRSPNTLDSYTLSRVDEIAQACCVAGVSALALAKEAAATGVKVWFIDADGTQDVVGSQ